MTLPTDDEKEAYKRGRAAIRNLGKDRNFHWWEDYGTALIAAQGEAMRAAFTNQPIGKAYNHEIDRILHREKLVDYTREPHFPDKNTRKDAMAMVENLHRPVDTRRLKGILAWRADSLSPNERQRVNHPTAILRRWRKDTEPVEEKRVARLQREMQGPKENPFVEALADTEVREIEARRHAEGARGLLGRVLDEVEDLHPELREAIERFLAS